jgi:hypothetical protein
MDAGIATSGTANDDVKLRDALRHDERLLLAGVMKRLAAA